MRLVALLGAVLAASTGAVPAGGGDGSAGLAGDPVIVAAGDIAGQWNDDEATATLIDVIDPDLVLALGDMAYPDGTVEEYQAYYVPTWGRHKQKTKPIPGNHDYHVPGASAYYEYFGEAAGDPARGYYAFDLDGWRLYALNSNCDDVPCGAGSAQEQWFREDLAAHPRSCTLAYIHHSRFSSHAEEARRDNRRLAALYQAFYEASGDVWLSAHQHFYERFAPIDPAGAVDEERGVRTFVVGTGGAPLYEFGEPLPGSQVRGNEAHGVVRLVLREARYEWAFVPEAGRTFTDSGAERCEPDTAPPSAPADVAAVASGPGRIDLSWTASDDDVGVTGYDVFRDGVLLASTASGTEYADLDVLPATTYSYTVVARDEAGHVSPASSVVFATTFSLPPTAPTDLEALPAGATRIDLTWVAATDDVAVSGYDVLRDGVLLASVGPQTTYVDTAVSPATTYVYTVLARDEAGTPSLASNEATATTPPLPRLVTFAAEADARVEQANPTLNFGRNGLRTDGGRDPAVDSYLRFTVSGLTGPITHATLRVFAATPTADGPAVYTAPNGWSENTLTWDSRPVRSGEPLHDIGAVADDTWIEYDVTAALTGDGNYTFVLAQSGSDGVDLRSRESLVRPELVVRVGSPPLVVAAEADARVEQSSPTLNFGRNGLRTDGGRDPAVESYVRFTVSGLTGRIAHATLRVFAATPTADGPAVYTALNGWSEGTLTWDTRPLRSGEPLDDVGAVGDDSWIEYDVSAALTGDGTYTFVLAQSGNDGVDLRSRESPLPPQLVVETRD